MPWQAEGATIMPVTGIDRRIPSVPPGCIAAGSITSMTRWRDYCGNTRRCRAIKQIGRALNHVIEGSGLSPAGFEGQQRDMCDSRARLLDIVRQSRTDGQHSWHIDMRRTKYAQWSSDQASGSSGASTRRRTLLCLEISS